MDGNKELFEQLKNLSNSATLIVGIGNTLKGDDGAGPKVCEQLHGKVCAEIIDAGTVPENYIQTIIKKAPKHILIIDAVDFGAPAGTIKIFKSEQIKSSFFSTHTLSPRLFVDMVCQEIKVDVYFVGIQPAHMQFGQPKSAQVSEAIQWLVGAVTKIFPLKK